MAWAVIVDGSQTAVITTEHVIAETGGANDVPAGPTHVLAVDLSALTTGDIVEVRIYTKARSGGTVRQYDVVTYDFADAAVAASPGLQSIPHATGIYVKYTLKQTNGVGRAFPWAVYGQ